MEEQSHAWGGSDQTLHQSLKREKSLNGKRWKRRKLGKKDIIERKQKEWVSSENKRPLAHVGAGQEKKLRGENQQISDRGEQRKGGTIAKGTKSTITNDTPQKSCQKGKNQKRREYYDPSRKEDGGED